MRENLDGSHLVTGGGSNALQSLINRPEKLGNRNVLNGNAISDFFPSLKNKNKRFQMIV